MVVIKYPNRTPHITHNKRASVLAVLVHRIVDSSGGWLTVAVSACARNANQCTHFAYITHAASHRINIAGATRCVPHDVAMRPHMRTPCDVSLNLSAAAHAMQARWSGTAAAADGGRRNAYGRA